MLGQNIISVDRVLQLFKITMTMCLPHLPGAHRNTEGLAGALLQVGGGVCCAAARNHSFLVRTHGGLVSVTPCNTI